MKTILLAAGSSQRLHPLSDKNFLDFCGSALLENQVKTLRAVGLNEVIIVAGEHNFERARRLFAADTEITLQKQENLSLGMAGAILSCAPLLAANEPIFVISANDILPTEAYRLVLDRSARGDLDGALLGYRVERYFPGGYLRVDDNNRLLGIVEKPGPGREPSSLINLVAHYHRDSSRFLEALSQASSTRDDLYETALDALFKGGSFYQAVPYGGFWQAIKYPWHLHGAWRQFFAAAPKQISPSAVIHPTAVISGEVIIADGVKIFPHAVISGPVYLGQGSVVSNNALVRESHLGAGCVVGFNTEITRSYLGKEVWTHSNYIGDSVIGGNVSFGAGSITANLRLDEEEVVFNVLGEKIGSGSNKCGIVCADNVRVGVGVKLMPGTKIGTNVLIASGLVIAEDIPDHSFVSGDWRLKIRPNRFSVDNLSRGGFLSKLGAASFSPPTAT